jgi:hypothetical protein
MSSHQCGQSSRKGSQAAAAAHAAALPGGGADGGSGQGPTSKSPAAAAAAAAEGTAAVAAAATLPNSAPTVEFRTGFDDAAADADGWIRWNRDGTLDFEG